MKTTLRRKSRKMNFMRVIVGVMLMILSFAMYLFRMHGGYENVFWAISGISIIYLEWLSMIIGAYFIVLGSWKKLSRLMR